MPPKRDEFLEKYRHVFRSICLDGFINRLGEQPEGRWMRVAKASEKIDEFLGKIFDELVKPPVANGPVGQPQPQKGQTK